MSRGGVRALLGASATVTLATVIVNLLSYVLVAAGTRVLGADRYGELAALLGLLLVGNVPAATIQVVLARRVAAGEPGGLGLATIRASVVVTVVAAVAIPVLHSTVHISVGALVFMTAALLPMTLAGAPMGAAQGLHLFGRLAATTMIVGIGRVGGMIAGLAVGGTATTAMVGLLIGTSLSLVGACQAIRGPAWQGLVEPDREQAGTTSREIGHASVTMLAMAAIMTADVLLAKRYLPAVDSGRYGAGAIVTKVAIWLPYAITMIALPRLAVAHHRKKALRVSILALTTLGILEVAGVLVLGGVIFPLAVGDEYRSVNGLLWLWATQGAVLAIAQLVIMSRIAATDRLVGPLLWVALLAEVGAVSVWHNGLGQILAIATGTAIVVAGAMLVLPIRQKPGAGTELELGLQP